MYSEPGAGRTAPLGLASGLGNSRWSAHSFAHRDSAIVDAAAVTAREAAPTLGGLLNSVDTSSHTSEQEWVALVRAIASGDTSAFGTLYMSTHGIVFTSIARITGDRATAEELTVDVFHDVWRGASGLRPGQQLGGRVDHEPGSSARTSARTSGSRHARRGDARRRTETHYRRASCHRGHLLLGIDVRGSGLAREGAHRDDQVAHPLRPWQAENIFDARKWQAMSTVPTERRCEHSDRVAIYALGALPKNAASQLNAHLPALQGLPARARAIVSRRELDDRLADRRHQAQCGHAQGRGTAHLE